MCIQQRLFHASTGGLSVADCLREINKLGLVGGTGLGLGGGVKVANPPSVFQLLDLTIVIISQPREGGPSIHAARGVGHDRGAAVVCLLYASAIVCPRTRTQRRAPQERRGAMRDGACCRKHVHARHQDRLRQQRPSTSRNIQLTRRLDVPLIAK